MGPYRSRLVPSLDLEQFCTYVSHRKRRRRWIGALLCAAALVATASFAAAIVDAQVEEEPLVANGLEAWGIQMSDAGVSPLSGAVPRRADPADGSIDFARAQRAVQKALPALEQCHRDHPTQVRGVLDGWLFVEVLLLGRQPPDVRIRPNRSAQESGLAQCIDRVFSNEIDFPEPADRAALVTYPIRLPRG